MKYTQTELPLLNNLIESLSKHFGPKHEFVVHDYSKDFGSTIVAISNGELTGRSIGKGGTDIGLKILQGLVEEDGRYNYITQTQNGRLLRSSTIYLRDDNNEVIGSLCINFDITDLIQTKGILEELINFNKTEESKIEAVVFENIEDLLVSIIQESINYIGVPVVLMTREQKVEGISYLNKRGTFKIKNAANVVANYYDVSKYTVYNYLNEIDAGSDK